MSDTSYPAPSQADDKTTIAAPPPPPQTFTSESSIADATVSLQDPPAPTAQQAQQQQPVPETLESKSAPNPKTANGFAKASSSSAPARTRLKRDNSTPNMNGPLYMQTSGNKTVLVRRLKRKEESTWKHLARWFVENQIGMSSPLIEPASPFPFPMKISSIHSSMSEEPGPSCGVDGQIPVNWIGLALN
jgi:hypothetical protein